MSAGCIRRVVPRAQWVIWMTAFRREGLIHKEPGLVDRRGNYSNGGGSPSQACFVFDSTASVNTPPLLR
jgi:hypothetical protein